MLKASRAHLAECHETYLAHLLAATRISATLLAAALACAVHAFVPGLFTRSASLRVERVRASIITRRSASISPETQASDEGAG
ncbi:MAG: hypothetical protein JO335_03940 [Sphingomonas sp.]|nr:hypothetical protein [Sphingomonas sp.]